MFLGNSVPISVFAGQNLEDFGDTPTLYRNFLIDPQLNGPENPESRIGPDLIYTRPTAASYWTSLSTIQYVANNIHRFNYNKGTFLGLLIEEARANLISYSDDFRAPIWFIPSTTIPFNDPLPGVTVTPNSIQAPDGTNTGTLITQFGGEGYHTIVWATGTPVEPAQYSRTIYVKRGTARYIAITCASTPFQAQVFRVFDFDLPGYVGGLLIGTSFEHVGNGWYKLTIDRVSSNSNTNKLGIAIVETPQTASVQYTPNSTLSGVYIWGAQVERGNFATSYIPTSGSSLIRAADYIDIRRPNFKNMYNRREGTYYTKASRFLPRNSSSTTLATVIGDNTSQYWTLNTGALTATISPTIMSMSNITGVNVLAPNITFDLAIGLKKDNSVIFQNQTLVTEIPTIQLPTIVNKFQIGNFSNSNFLNGHIQIIGYWPKRFADSIIESLTGQSSAV
jgi:hypothetical protein